MTAATVTTMHTIKLVVIGASGVGKTSLRGQFISGRFSSGYRATIGADFIAKTLTHPTKPEELVTLQIWDTAGQERFSSLSTAFFRGADAVILVFDVHQPETLEALRKWWAEFCVGAPLAEEDLPEHPCFIVGNKIDLTMEEEHDTDRIPLVQIQRFIAGLIPFEEPTEEPPLPPITNGSPTTPTPVQVQRSTSIDIKPRISPTDDTKQKSLGHTRSLSGSTSKFNTLSSINTTASIYHTPSSSIFSDAFHTARSSPEPTTSAPMAAHSSLGVPPAFRQRRPTTLSTGSASSGSATTITPSLFAREQRENAAGTSSNGTTLTTPEEGILYLPDSDNASVSVRSSGPPLSPERGPSLHFTSAKTGEGVKELFEHVAARVIRKMEYEEYFEARRLHYREASGVEAIRLGTDDRTQRKGFERIRVSCCS